MANFVHNHLFFTEEPNFHFQNAVQCNCGLFASAPTEIFTKHVRDMHTTCLDNQTYLFCRRSNGMQETRLCKVSNRLTLGVQDDTHAAAFRQSSLPSRLRPRNTEAPGGVRVNLAHQASRYRTQTRDISGRALFLSQTRSQRTVVL